MANIDLNMSFDCFSKKSLKGKNKKCIQTYLHCGTHLDFNNEQQKGPTTRASIKE